MQIWISGCWEERECGYWWTFQQPFQSHSGAVTYWDNDRASSAFKFLFASASNSEVEREVGCSGEQDTPEEPAFG